MLRVALVLALLTLVSLALPAAAEYPERPSAHDRRRVSRGRHGRYRRASRWRSP